MTTQKKKAKGKRKQGMTTKQKKLVLQMPAVVEGKKTKMQAALDAGYAPESARQQMNVYGALRTNTAMQEALLKAGVTEDKLAAVIADGLSAEKAVSVESDSNESGREVIREPDHHARHKFVVTAAELKDAFPATKQITIPATIDDLIKAQEAGPAPAA